MKIKPWETNKSNSSSRILTTNCYRGPKSHKTHHKNCHNFKKPSHSYRTKYPSNSLKSKSMNSCSETKTKSSHMISRANCWEDNLPIINQSNTKTQNLKTYQKSSLRDNNLSMSNLWTKRPNRQTCRPNSGLLKTKSGHLHSRLIIWS